MRASAHLLMCRPEHYRVAYEINPWMDRTDPVDEPRAGMQWEHLYRLFVDLGARVELIEQQPSVPDMVFTANAGVVSGSQFIPSNFRHPERQPERDFFVEWFKDRSYTIETIDSAVAWEGEGDVLDTGNHVIAASGFRTDPEALNALDGILGIEGVRLELIDPRFYHLDTCFFPVDDHCALFVPEAFSDASRKRLATAFDDLIEVPTADALRFACNALRIGDTVVLNAGCEATEAALQARGYRCAPTPMGEFIRAGGSVKCLVLTLDTFEGASTRR